MVKNIIIIFAYLEEPVHATLEHDHSVSIRYVVICSLRKIKIFIIILHRLIEFIKVLGIKLVILYTEVQDNCADPLALEAFDFTPRLATVHF